MRQAPVNTQEPEQSREVRNQNRELDYLNNDGYDERIAGHREGEDDEEAHAQQVVLGRAVKSGRGSREWRPEPENRYENYCFVWI